VVVRGRVQGVWFRATCRREAEAADVGGWIANRPDGAVEAVFEGGAPAVQRMVTWCADGPPGAAVTDVSVTDEVPEGVVGFRITG
jgi:acylphosphatase